MRNLKILLAAALALTSLGAIAANAQAAHRFHCSVNPCRYRATPDGNPATEGKTAHQVFIVENSTTTESVSFTCNEVTGEGTFVGGEEKSSEEATAENIAYKNCSVNGSPGVVVDMNGCKFLFTAAGGTTDEAEVHVICTSPNQIEVTIPGGCVFKIGDQRVKGIGYHNEGTSPNTNLTLTANVHGIKVTRNAACESLIKSSELTGTYTTGNVTVTGETPEGVMAEAWYAEP